ncbi:hypothetical protein K435DRAFT_873075 [Dendrothele bispora CBS 962.96]|uniref:Uncharacterized protein n=1 Tax=Dendrothele bispora (strain CBS 962.96) TaxID=1314807 RepID=A0A4S8L007_DENBC|nr:hypothetical protein K435DRAFT_873075 [Dendrothele bispora CBS 962.96]
MNKVDEEVNERAGRGRRSVVDDDRVQSIVGGDLLDAGDLGVRLGPDDGPSYWGIGDGRLELLENPL